MGTKVQSKSCLPGYYSMRDLNDDSNSCSWPNYFGDKSLTNDQYYSSVAADSYQGYDRDILKQMMLEHEATFQYQVYELHRLYRIQRDLMDGMKKKDLHKFRVPIETSLSSSPLASQSTSEDGRKWHNPSFPFSNSALARPSVSGVEDIHSSLNSMRGSGNQGSPFLSQKGVSSKDVEVLESRPSKVRKMLDLQLPADAYIDTNEAEQLRGDNVSGVYLLNGNGKIIPENRKKLILSDYEETNHQGVSSRSKLCLRTTDALADLNEPVQVEETSDFACSGFLERHSSFRCETQGHDLPTKSNHHLLGFCQEISVNSHNQNDNSSMKTLHAEHRASANGFFSPPFDAEHGRSSFKSVSQGPHLDKLHGSSQSIQVHLGKAHEPPSCLVSHQSRQDTMMEKTSHRLDSYDRHHELSNNSHLESVVNSNIPRPLLVSSDITNSWPHSTSSWEKPCSLSQKSSAVQPLLFLSSAGTCNRNSPISTQSNGIFGEKSQHNSSRLPPGFGNELHNRNGFYYGSSSGTKEPAALSTTISHSYLSHSNDKGLASDSVTDHFATKVSNCLNTIDMNSASSLNVMLSNGLSNDLGRQLGCDNKIGDRKHEDSFYGLPWLRPNSTSKIESSSMGRNSTIENGFLHSSRRLSEGKNETGNGVGQNFTQNVKSVSCSNEVEDWRAGMNSSLCEKKITGIPIFEQPSVLKNDSFSLSSSASIPHPPEETAEGSRKPRLFDMNLPCDDAFPDTSEGIVLETVAIEMKEDLKVESSRHEIDLNACAHEDEPSFAPTTPTIVTKIAGLIDLEALPAPETDDAILEKESGQEPCEASILTLEQEKEYPQDEIVQIAAEAIVAISSLDMHADQNVHVCLSSQTSLRDPLQWFVDTVHSFGEHLDNKIDSYVAGKLVGGNRDKPSLEEIDDFEYMTLKLAVTKGEDYLPTPLVPENLKLEESGRNLLTTRTRKGQRRRGGQRRDFQRDILPGLVSLSRHEVTEDLQTFGGLMRATGYIWQSGTTRRNSTRSGARGRRRTVSSSALPVQPVGTSAAPLVQQLSNIEVALEDRSLTGWGKTTRRPRRQRCPAAAAGNPPAIPLT